MLTPLRRRVRKKEPGRYHHGDLERAMIEAAIVLIERRGLTAWTMREASRLAGVSPGAPYRHFADKETLLARVAEEGFALLADALMTARERAGDNPLLQLRAMGTEQQRFAQRHPSHYRAMFGPHRLDERLYPSMHGNAMATFAAVLQGVERCREAGLLRDWEAQELALLGWALNHGLADLTLNGHLERAGFSREDIVDLPARLGQLVFEGCAPEGFPKLPRPAKTSSGEHDLGAAESTRRAARPR